MPETHNTKTPVCIAAIMLLGIGYVLSYPLVLKYYVDRNFFIEAHIVFYTPVEWLIDETPMRDPIVEWAEMFGCGPWVEAASDYRDPPAISRWPHLPRAP